MLMILYVMDYIFLRCGRKELKTFASIVSRMIEQENTESHLYCFSHNRYPLS